MASSGAISRVLAIGFLVAAASGCDEEFWFNADGSGRYRTILNDEEIKLADSEHHGFDWQCKHYKESFAKTKLRANMTREVVFGKTRWIQDLEYDSEDQLSWIDDKKAKHDVSQWKSTSERNGDLKYEYSRKLGKESDYPPRQVTVHLPGRIISSNADAVDEKENVATWDITTHKSITPTVVVRLPEPAKKDGAKKRSSDGLGLRRKSTSSNRS